jgi:hypothetical protein
LIKKILITFISLLIFTSVSYSLEQYKREIRLKCEVTKTDLITDKDDSRFAFAEHKITPFTKTFNIYIPEFKVYSPKERNKFWYVDTKNNIIYFHGFFHHLKWMEVVEGERINKNYISKNNVDIVAQLYVNNWWNFDNWKNVTDDFQVWVYNLNKKNLEELKKIQKNINFSAPLSEKELNYDSKFVDDYLFNTEFFAKHLGGKCKKS